MQAQLRPRHCAPAACGLSVRLAGGTGMAAGVGTQRGVSACGATLQSMFGGFDSWLVTWCVSGVVQMKIADMSRREALAFTGALC
jgi:hypothetical protein